MNPTVTNAASWIASAWKSHWKIIASVAAGTIVATLATALILGTGGTATPFLFLAAGASGTLGAGTTQTVDDLLEHKRPGLDVAESAAIGGAVSVVTLGAGRALAPVVPEGIARFLPGAMKPLESDAQLVQAALQKNIPWGAIPRIILNQPISDVVTRVEIGLVGALSGTEAQRPATPAPAPKPGPAPPATPPHAPQPAPAAAARVPDGPLGESP
jgi:hypothetical protein